MDVKKNPARWSLCHRAGLLRLRDGEDQSERKPPLFIEGVRRVVGPLVLRGLGEGEPPFFLVYLCVPLPLLSQSGLLGLLRVVDTTLAALLDVKLVVACLALGADLILRVRLPVIVDPALLPHVAARKNPPCPIAPALIGILSLRATSAVLVEALKVIAMTKMARLVASHSHSEQR
jgi:hypothetical protein